MSGINAKTATLVLLTLSDMRNRSFDMNEEKKPLGARIGDIMGQVLATTMVICAWLIVIAFTLKCLWFIIFRFLG